MKTTGSSKLIENVLVLAVLGILAGAAGGLAIGYVTSRTGSSSAGSAPR